MGEEEYDGVRTFHAVRNLVDLGLGVRFGLAKQFGPGLQSGPWCQSSARQAVFWQPG